MCAGACVLQSTDKADNIKLDGSVDTPAGRNVIQLKSCHETPSVFSSETPNRRKTMDQVEQMQSRATKKDPSPEMPLL